MNFEEAMKAVLDGKKITRVGWKEHGIYAHMKDGKLVHGDGSPCSDISGGDADYELFTPEDILLRVLKEIEDVVKNPVNQQTPKTTLVYINNKIILSLNEYIKAKGLIE